MCQLKFRPAPTQSNIIAVLQAIPALPARWDFWRPNLIETRRKRFTNDNYNSDLLHTYAYSQTIVRRRSAKPVLLEEYLHAWLSETKLCVGVLITNLYHNQRVQKQNSPSCVWPKRPDRSRSELVPSMNTRLSKWLATNTRWWAEPCSERPIYDCWSRHPPPINKHIMIQYDCRLQAISNEI